MAARLTGWDIDILTPDEYNVEIEKLSNCVKSVEGADDLVTDKLIALGIISVDDLVDVGGEPLVKELKIKQELATKIIEKAKSEAKRIAAERKRSQAENILKEQVRKNESV